MTRPTGSLLWLPLLLGFAAACALDRRGDGRGDDDDASDDDTWSDDDASDDDGSDDDASDDDASDDDASDDDGTPPDDDATASDDDTWLPDDDTGSDDDGPTCPGGYHCPRVYTWSFTVWPEFSGDVVAGYGGNLFVSYYDYDGYTLTDACGDVFLFSAAFDTPPPTYPCPGCLGEIHDFAVDYYASSSTCDFYDPSEWLDEDFLNGDDGQDLLRVQVSPTIPVTYPLVDVEAVIDSFEDAGWDVTHGGYRDDYADVDMDGNTTENVPWGIFGALPGTWEEDFTTVEEIQVGETPTEYFFFLPWWAFALY